MVDQSTTTDDNVVLVLDLTNSNGSTPKQLMNNWRTVSPDMTSGKFDVLLAPQAIAVDDEYFFINGGFTTDKFATQTLQYSATENKFYSEFVYTEPPYGTRQM